MSKLEVKKVEDVSFEIGARYNGVLWRMKNGSIYISLSNLLLTDGNSWYDVPISTLEKIAVLQEEPLKVQLTLPNIVIILTGGNADRLLALRHLLLPYLSQEGGEDLKALLKLWQLGIKNVPGLKMLLYTTDEEINRLIQEAKDGALIDGEGNITKRGMDLFSQEELNLLKEVVDE
jgi:hypothetical protein